METTYQSGQGGENPNKAQEQKSDNFAAQMELTQSTDKSPIELYSLVKGKPPTERGDTIKIENDFSKFYGIVKDGKTIYISGADILNALNMGYWNEEFTKYTTKSGDEIEFKRGTIDIPLLDELKRKAVLKQIIESNNLTLHDPQRKFIGLTKAGFDNYSKTCYDLDLSKGAANHNLHKDFNYHGRHNNLYIFEVPKELDVIKEAGIESELDFLAL